MNTEQEKLQKYFSLKTILRLFLVLFLVVIVLFASSVFFLALAQLIDKGFNDKNIVLIQTFLLKVIDTPLFLIEAYQKWFDVFMMHWHKGHFSFAVFVPLGTPILFLFILWFTFRCSKYSFGLWFRFNNRYAEIDDVQSMGLFDGTLMALGCFEDHILKLKKGFSALCLGETGCGKTAGVAIPSILESDGACIVASDNHNELAKYTSGYRSKLGKVFYFNWSLRDEPLKNEYYPRWNPLSAKEMPNKGEEREKYIDELVRYFIFSNKEREKDQYWERLAVSALGGILRFFIVKLEQANANDYFLSKILEKTHLSKEDKDILLSYYALMDKKYSLPAIKNMELGKFQMDNYLPIGSWQGIPAAWQGKEISFPMFSDWLLQSYFSIKNSSENKNIDGWKTVIAHWLEEAEFFGYGKDIVEPLQQLFYMSRKQRSIIFPMLINPLAVFRNANIRERTSTCDFSISQSRGIKNPETGAWELVTVYNIAGSKSVDFVGKMFMDMIISKNISPQENYGPFPLLFVIDDIEQQPKYEELTNGLMHASQSQSSFLLLSDYVKMMHERYGTQALEEIVSNATYKLMLADNNKTLAWKFENLAMFGTKSVQIPAQDSGILLRAKKGLTDASYYKVIARNLKDERKHKLEIGDEFLIAAGYYHLPIKLKSLYFLKDDLLKEKAAEDASYFLDEDVLKERNLQDIETPDLLSVLKESGIDVKNEDDVNMFLEDKYEEAIETRQVVADKQSALVDDISARWKKGKNTHQNTTESDWWMDEDAFEFNGTPEETNPFQKK